MGKTTTEMQLVPLSRLVPYVNNARTHSPEQLTKLRSSLREFGFINPVIIDRDFNVIAGHGRIAAAKEESMEEVPCVFVDYLTEAQKKAYILADNRMALDAGWDEELLRIEIESLQGADFDVSLTGFEEGELADLFAGDGEKDVKDDDFDLSAALEKAAFVERGDIWTVGRHRLVCGDATSAEDVAALINDVQTASGKEVFGTLSASMGSKQWLGNQEAFSGDYHIVEPEYIVRRLTPTECARLQGFPDWWCGGLGTEEPTGEDLVFWREVFETHRKIAGTSTKPKTDKQIIKWLKNPHSDSAEYKMWGNGVALPNVYFVLSGIVYYAQFPDFLL